MLLQSYLYMYRPLNNFSDAFTRAPSIFISFICIIFRSNPKKKNYREGGEGGEGGEEERRSKIYHFILHHLFFFLSFSLEC